MPYSNKGTLVLVCILAPGLGTTVKEKTKLHQASETKSKQLGED